MFTERKGAWYDQGGWLRHSLVYPSLNVYDAQGVALAGDDEI